MSPEDETGADATRTAEVSRTDAFVSYARVDEEAVREGLAKELRARGKTLWVDDRLIPAAPWRPAIAAAIERARAMIFVMTPESVASPECMHELEHAMAANKLLIPVLARDVERERIPPALREPHWVRPAAGAPLASVADQLVEVLETDFDWRESQSRLSGNVADWRDAGQDKSRLLRGTGLRDAEDWLRTPPPKRQQATPEQIAFIVESRRQHSRALRRRLLLAVGVSIALAALAATALVLRSLASSRERVARSRALAAEAVSAMPRDGSKSVALSVRALKIEQTAQAVDAARDGLQASHLEATIAAGGGGLALQDLSRDGQRLLVAGDSNARVWDTRRLRPVSPLVRDESRITAVALDRRGRFFATGDADGTTRIRDVKSGRLTATMHDAGAVTILLLSPDSATALTVANQAATARLWDVHSGRRLRVLHQTPTAAGRSFVDEASFDGLGIYVLTQSEGAGTVWIWTSPDGQPIGRIKTNALIEGARVLPNDDSLATIGSDNVRATLGAPASARRRYTMHLLSIATGVDEQSLRLGGLPIGVDVADDGGRLVVVGAGQGDVESWFPDDGGEQPLIGDTFGLQSFALTTNGRVVATTDGLGATLWSVRTGHAIAALTGLPVRTIRIADDGSTVTTAGGRGIVAIWRPGVTVTAPEPLPDPSQQGATPNVDRVAFSRDGRHGVSLMSDGQADLWDARSGDISNFDVLTRQREPLAIARCTARFSASGRELTTACGDGAVRRLSAKSLRPVGGFAYNQELAFTPVLSPDGSREAQVASARASTLEVRRIADGRVIRRLSCASQPIAAAAFTGGPGTILVIARDGRSCLADVHSGRLLAARRFAVGAISRVAVSSSGKRVAVLGARTTAIWEPDGSSPPKPFPAIGTEYGDVAFSRDDRFFAAPGSGNTLVVYDLEEGRRAATLSGYGSPVKAVAFSPDGRRIAAAGEQDSVALVTECRACVPAASVLDTAASGMPRRLRR